MKVSALQHNVLADFLPLADGDAYLTMLSDVDRARLYPYHAPSGGYLLADGALYQLAITPQIRRCRDYSGDASLII